MAENPIKYSDLFQDDGALDALIKKIKELEEIYGRLSKSIRTELKGVRTETEKLTVVDDSHIEQLKANEKQVEKLIKSNHDLKDVEIELAKAKKDALTLAKKDADLIAKRNA